MYGFSFYTNHFEVSRPDFPKNGILGTKFKKAVVQLKISSLEYPFVSNYSLNKALSSIGINFAEKSILGKKFRKTKSLSTLF